ncbi:MAG TPA: hypothetical protein VKK79_24325 [Candidatus Lokiarchaeia archaeon]|nr:hypothetical protein [Candidatus Lokiarchaeia archaeon]
MIATYGIFFIIGIVLALFGIIFFYVKERFPTPLNPILGALVKKPEYGKVFASACITTGIIIWFVSVPYSGLNVLILIAFIFTFPGDFILSRDLTKLFLAIPLFAVAYMLMAVRGLYVVFNGPVDVLALVLCLVVSIITIVAIILRYVVKLSPQAMKIATGIYSVVEWTVLFSGLALIFVNFALIPGIGMILFVIGDVIAVINLNSPINIKNKPVYDLAGGIIYFAGLFSIALYFTL